MGIFSIVWLIIKIIIAIAIVFYSSLFIYGLLRLMVERSNNSILKMIFKVILLIILGSVLAYYLGVAVSHFFGDQRVPVSGGVGGIIMLFLLLINKIVGDMYMSASILAVLMWIGIFSFIAKAMFTNEPLFYDEAEEPKPLSEKEIEAKKIQEGKEALKELREFAKKNKKK